MTFVAGQLGELSFQNNINDPWTAYTPTLTNATLGNGTIKGRYKQIGKTVYFSSRFTLGSTSTVSSSASMSLPVTAVTATNMNPGQILIVLADVSAAINVPGTSGGATFTTIITPYYSVGGSVTASLPFVWATGDYIDISGVYEAA